MNTEDCLTMIGEESTTKEKENAREDRRGCKRERRDRQTSFDKNKRRDDKTSWMIKFTPLVMPIDKILM